MAALNTLHDALMDEIRDLYHAEQQLVKAIPKMAKTAHNQRLREALDTHLAETQNHVQRLEQVFGLLDAKPKGKTCEGMEGIIDEGSNTLKANAPNAVVDARIIASAQRMEHYEIAAYGTVAAWAEGLGLSEVAGLLRQTLDEEEATDAKLTDLAEAGINEAAELGRDEATLDTDETGEGTGRVHGRR